MGEEGREGLCVVQIFVEVCVPRYMYVCTFCSLTGWNCHKNDP